MVSGRGRGKTQLSTKKVTFGAPGGVFWWFSWKNHDFLTFPHFWWKGHLSAPPYAKPCYGNAFSMVLGGTVSPKSRNNAFSSYFPIFSLFFMFSWKDVKIPRKHQKVPTFCVWGGECPPESIENDSNYNGFRGGRREGAQGTRSCGI